jgi:hypothetical protein
MQQREKIWPTGQHLGGRVKYSKKKKACGARVYGEKVETAQHHEACNKIKPAGFGRGRGKTAVTTTSIWEEQNKNVNNVVDM